MLDDNLPTFIYKPSDNPLSTVIYFTHVGSAPAPEYLLRRPEPSASKNTFALALADARYPDVIFSEILVKPEFAQPTLSAAEIRAQSSSAPRRTGTGITTPPEGLLLPVVPDTVVLRLYNPDQNVGIRMLAGGWSRTDAWEFEMPEHSFRAPSASQIDQGGGTANPDVVDFAPKVVFRWKRDGRLSKDMTCYMTGKSVAGKKSKEPDITIAMYKGGKNESVTVYEPNLQRVDVQDRKGLEVVLLLGASVIRDLYLDRKNDPFNTTAPSPKLASASGPMPGGAMPRGPMPAELDGASAPRAPVMSGAISSSVPASSGPYAPQSHASTPQATAVDMETRRLREQMEAENQRQQQDRERRDREEQDRIRRMLEEEEGERRRRDAEVEAETERLRRMYGTDGQEYNNASSPPPAPPPRPGPGGPVGPVGWGAPPPPAPLTTAPQGNWFTGPGGSAATNSPVVHFSPAPSFGPGPVNGPNPQPNPQPSPQPGGSGDSSNNRTSRWFSRDSLGLVYNGVTGASSSGFFGRKDEGGSSGGNSGGAGGGKLQKKKSLMW